MIRVAPILTAENVINVARRGSGRRLRAKADGVGASVMPYRMAGNCNSQPFAGRNAGILTAHRMRREHFSGNFFFVFGYELVVVRVLEILHLSF